MPVQLISQSLTKASALPFFERQREALCGLHALNNALGAEKFNRDQLTAACNLYLQESEDMEAARSEHIGPGGATMLFASKCQKSSIKRISPGWYSVQVLYTALFAAGLAA